MDDITGFIGRARETEQALTAIAAGRNLLVKGRGGIGKSAFLQHVHGRLETDRPVVWLADGSPKLVATEFARQLHEQVGLTVPRELIGPKLLARAQRQGGLEWEKLARTIRRLPIDQTADLITGALRKQKCLVFIEALEVPPTLADLYAEVLNLAQVAACMDDNNRRSRIDRLVWRFHETLELRPLPLEECEYLVTLWIQDNPIRFTNDRTKRRFVRHVAQDSGGVPAAIRGMLESAAAEQEITPAKARGFEHEAGVRYLDMTPVVVLMLVAAMAAKYVSRGAGLEEMMIWSGVAMALFTGMRFFLGMLRGR